MCADASHSVPAVNSAPSGALCFATKTVFGSVTHSFSTCLFEEGAVSKVGI